MGKRDVMHTGDERRNGDVGVVRVVMGVEVVAGTGAMEERERGGSGKSDLCLLPWNALWRRSS
jgi:hypothetical protein